LADWQAAVKPVCCCISKGNRAAASSHKQCTPDINDLFSFILATLQQNIVTSIALIAARIVDV
jgi:hypothetical protein